MGIPRRGPSLHLWGEALHRNEVPLPGQRLQIDISNTVDLLVIEGQPANKMNGPFGVFKIGLAQITRVWLEPYT